MKEIMVFSQKRKQKAKTKRADVVSNVIEKTWLTRYPRPSVITLDRGKEFMAEVTKMIKNDYGIKKRPITVRNPQANSIIERVHQTISNIIRTFAIYDTTVDMEDPWSEKCPNTYPVVCPNNYFVYLNKKKIQS